MSGAPVVPRGMFDYPQMQRRRALTRAPFVGALSDKPKAGAGEKDKDKVEEVVITAGEVPVLCVEKRRRTGWGNGLPTSMPHLHLERH